MSFCFVLSYLCSRKCLEVCVLNGKILNWFAFMQRVDNNLILLGVCVDLFCNQLGIFYQLHVFMSDEFVWFCCSDMLMKFIICESLHCFGLLSR